MSFNKSKTEGVNVTLATSKCCLPLLSDKLAYASEVCIHEGRTVLENPESKSCGLST